MSYSTEYRERIIEYRKAGHTLEETHRTFQVSVETIRNWEKRLERVGHLEKKSPHRGYKKIDPEKLTAYVAEHPDAYQKEIAEAFGCSAAAICLAMKRLKITREKEAIAYWEQDEKKAAAYQAEIRVYPRERIIRSVTDTTIRLICLDE